MQQETSCEKCTSGDVQAQKAKFAAAGNKEPVFWLKHDPVRLLDGDASLKDAKLPAEARIELAVSFPGIGLLPDSSANKVPDPSKGTPLQPPGAFTVSAGSSLWCLPLTDSKYIVRRPDL